MTEEQIKEWMEELRDNDSNEYLMKNKTLDFFEILMYHIHHLENAVNDINSELFEIRKAKKDIISEYIKDNGRII